MASSVACSWRPPLAGAVAAIACARTSSSVHPGAGFTWVTRSRFSERVPVLSKHTTSTRPSASTERGLRTNAPALVSRRAEACWARVATSGSPSGTAATLTATPLATAWRRPVSRSSPRPGHQPAAGQAERQGLVGQLAQLGLQPDR